MTITATGCRLAFASPSAVAEAAFVEMGMMDKGAVSAAAVVKWCRARARRDADMLHAMAR